jgi:glycosyltransferase involved in cell wall biosynthesis
VESRVLAVTTSDESDALFRRITHGAISTKVVPNFVADVRAEDGAAAVRQCWLALGRLTPEKGLMELVRDWPDHHGLLIVGSGPQKQDLMSLVKHRVNVELRDAVSRDQMRDLIETHQGLVFPSQWHEAAPQVVVEAMRSRKPVVANRASLVADLVARTGSGSVYASRQELTESLDLVASRPSMFGANARALYELEWTPDVWFERMMQVYNGVA